jgi:hypothetical protein
MTLLVLEIAVPQLTHSEVAAGELSKQLFELWPCDLELCNEFHNIRFLLDISS